MNPYTAITTQLDPKLLSNPFEIQTNWYVLTGAACCGKTTLIEMLAGKGFQVIPESARDFFMSEIAKGRTLDEIRQDGTALQRGIATLQLSYENGFDVNRATFLDRALPDSLTFYRVHGMDPNEILPECFHYHYVTIFKLDRLPLQRDKTLGPEDDLNSKFLDEWLVRDYSALGYDVVNVPVLPPEGRLKFILDKISGIRLEA